MTAFRARISKLLWWTICATVLLVPIVISATGQEAFRTPKDLFFTAACILLLCTVVVRIAEAPMDVWRAIVEAPHLPAIAVGAVAWSGICALLATNRVLATRSVVHASLVAFFIVLTSIVARSKDIRASYVVVLPALINAVVFLMQRFDVWDPLRVDQSLPAHFRYSALVGNPNDVGSFFVAPALTVVALALIQKRAMWWASAALILAGVATGSITALAAAAAGLFVMAAIHDRRNAFRAGFTVLVLVVIVTAGFPPLRNRLVSIRNLAASGEYAGAFSGRVTPFLAAWEMAKGNLLTGVGPGCFGFEYFAHKVTVEARHPKLVEAYAHRFNFSEVHNDHLQILAECGVIGYLIALTAVLLLASGTFRRAAVVSQRSEFARLVSLPLAVALFVLCTAHFPLQLTAPTVAFGFIAALCIAWTHNGALPTDDSPRPLSRSRRIMHIAVIALAAVAGVLSIRHFVVHPYRCNVTKRAVQRSTMTALDSPAYARLLLARKNLERLGPCLSADRTDVDLHMLVAANLRMVARLDEALATYATALMYDRRPEIYYNIGMIHLDRGNREDAIRNLYEAVLFDRAILEAIPYEEVRAEISAMLVRARMPAPP